SQFGACSVACHRSATGSRRRSLWARLSPPTSLLSTTLPSIALLSQLFSSPEFPSPPTFLLRQQQSPPLPPRFKLLRPQASCHRKRICFQAWTRLSRQRRHWNPTDRRDPGQHLRTAPDIVLHSQWSAHLLRIAVSVSGCRPQPAGSSSA